MLPVGGYAAGQSSRGHGLAGFGGVGAALFDGVVHHDVAVFGSGYRASNEHEVLFGIDTLNLQVLHGHPLVAHLPGESLAFVDLARRTAAADGAYVAELLVGTMGLLFGALHVVPAHDTLKPLALRDPGDVDVLAGLKDVGFDFGALFKFRELLLVANSNFSQNPLGFHVSALKVTGHRFVDLTVLFVPKAELDGAVAIFAFVGLALNHRARAEFDHGDGDALTIFEKLGHADLSADESHPMHLLVLPAPSPGWLTTIFGVGAATFQEALKRRTVGKSFP